MQNHSKKTNYRKKQCLKADGIGLKTQILPSIYPFLVSDRIAFF